MKKLFVPLLILSFAACNKPNNSYTVTVSIAGIEDGKKVYIRKADQINQLTNIDTTEVLNGKISYKEIVDGPDMRYIYIEDVNGNIAYIAEPGTIDITAYKDSINASKVEGTPSNEELYDFIKDSKVIGDKMVALRTEYSKAFQSGDTVTISTLQEVFSDLQQEAQAYDINYVKANPESFISVMLIERMLLMHSRPLDTVQKLYNEVPESYKNSRVGKNIVSMIETAKQ
ncbi:DUF4369 domain-containing protein [Leptobacterium sp. I13]|uniref:DUF4369 domain-containing protein n=1 Tax=Leptobacterium meishanense TaxID=3128904 RepID=UPI0030EB8822